MTDPTLGDFLRALARGAGLLCTCCANTEHGLDKTGRHWVQPVKVRATMRHEPCRRCGQPCANARCDQLPPNPDGRGYGSLPRRPASPLARLSRGR